MTKIKKAAGALALVVTAAVAAEFAFTAGINSWDDPGFTWTNYMFINYWQSSKRLDFTEVPPMKPGDNIRIKYIDKTVIFKTSWQDVWCAPLEASYAPGCVWLGVRPLEYPLEVMPPTSENYNYYIPSGGYYASTPNPEPSGYVVPGDPIIVDPSRYLVN